MGGRKEIPAVHSTGVPIVVWALASRCQKGRRRFPSGRNLGCLEICPGGGDFEVRILNACAFTNIAEIVCPRSHLCDFFVCATTPSPATTLSLRRHTSHSLSLSATSPLAPCVCVCTNPSRDRPPVFAPPRVCRSFPRQAPRSRCWKVRSQWAGSSRSGTLETGSVKTPALESGTLESGTLESGTLESATMESATLESGTLESGCLKSGTLESGTLESGALKSEAIPCGCSTVTRR